MLLDNLFKPIDKGFIDITHLLNNVTLNKRVKGKSRGIILSNKLGGFYASDWSSKYSGLFFRMDGTLYKIIEEIKVAGEVTGIKNHLWCMEVDRGNLTETFFMPIYTNTLVYEQNTPIPVELILDVREIDDNHEWGRTHNLTVENDMIVIEYNKTRDNRENTDGREYQIFLVIAADKYMHFDKIGEWAKREYELDKALGLAPTEKYVYSIVKLFSRRIIFSAAQKKEEAIETVNRVMQNLDKLKEMQKDYSLVGLKDLNKKEVNFAYKSAINSLDLLITRYPDTTAIYSGLPFYPKPVPRDEAIALNTLIIEGEYKLAKEILLRQLEKIGRDGTIHLKGEQGSYADEIGWHFKRWDDLLGTLTQKNIIENYFKKEELDIITRKLAEITNFMIKFNTEEGVFSPATEHTTWMDSLDRSGIRIELQAFRLAIYHFMHRLTGTEIYKRLEIELRERVREKFWDGKNLSDGLNDPTIRPNIFIAAYIYPELLSKKEWECCYKHVVEKLWAEKVGFTTLDKKNPLYRAQYQPEETASLHNGCSFFWLNNLAALVLYRTNKKLFAKYIEGIIHNSTREILWKGSVGSHCEYSPVAKLTSSGSLMSAPALAMYAELINEVFVSR